LLLFLREEHYAEVELLGPRDGLQHAERGGLLRFLAVTVRPFDGIVPQSLQVDGVEDHQQTLGGQVLVPVELQQFLGRNLPDEEEKPLRELAEAHYVLLELGGVLGKVVGVDQVVWGESTRRSY